MEPGLDGRMHWLGMLSGHAKWGAFRSASAFVLPSHQENSDGAVARAMACPPPVLISNKINIWREVVQDGGGFAEPDTVEGATNLLTHFADLDHGARAKMRSAALWCFLEGFDIRVNATELVEMVQAGMAARSQPLALAGCGGRPND